jgi:phage gp45-like
MQRNTLLEMSGRVMHMAMRFTLNKGNDDPMMQELNLDGMNSDGRNKVERVQAFGFTSTPLPRDEDESKKGGSKNGVEQEKGPAAEGICLFLGGQRNHPVCIAIDDRRHRPMGLKPGENAQYDDIGQMTLLRRFGAIMLSLDTEEKGKDGKTQKTERYVSMRHVEKKKQDRKPAKGGSGEAPKASQLATQQQAAKKEDFKHEGETINTEVRCTKNRIEFRAGDTVVGYYDVQKKEWKHTGTTIINDASTISHKGTQYFSSDVHISAVLRVMRGLKPGNDLWEAGAPSGGPSLTGDGPGEPLPLTADALAYIASRDARVAAFEARIAALEARIAALEGQR